MKANEFVKKHGWTAAKKMIDGLKVEYHINGIKTSPTIVLDDGTTWISYDDLKRLVESWELVREHGSIERAKYYAQSPYTAPEVSERLNQAIADVEFNQ